MTTISNLAVPESPFGQPGAATGRATPTVAAVASTAVGTALVYVTFNARRLRDLSTDHGDFEIGYEVVRVTDFRTGPEYPAALARRLGECLAWAEVLAGHYLPDTFAPLARAAATSAQRECFDRLIQAWETRGDGSTGAPGAHLIDTAIDLGVLEQDLRRRCATANLHSKYLDPQCPSVRLPITSAAAVALLAGREMRWCTWDHLDLDRLVTKTFSDTLAGDSS
ncbi:hypothetical protein [Nocardia terpenica]|uniref:Uncharacterized protein n=1 Tax=Nocardia terpenica TaxID=455432 RepID=A0A6G9ZDL2_9NOCA|nr:hypothetical protein [Nocardia terpenica]QIS23709.1 hypothetical protein F6W96_40955 [Nocardia terpenica]